MSSSPIDPVDGPVAPIDEPVAAAPLPVGDRLASSCGIAPSLPGTCEQGSRDAPLAGRAILVAEDNAIIAMDIQMALEDRGALVVGPFEKLSDVIAALETETIDSAVMDVDLGGELSIPAIEGLAKRSVPVILTTGHDVAKCLPAPLNALPVVSKPFAEPTMIAALLSVLPPRE